jgi:hypothetical protein
VRLDVEDTRHIVQEILSNIIRQANRMRYIEEFVVDNILPILASASIELAEAIIDTT